MTLTHHLTNRQLADLEQELRHESARLERSISARTASGDASLIAGRGRQANPQEDGLTGALETRILARHQLVVAALRRLEDGTYGDCLSCRGPIPYGRLLAVPEATSCVGCSAGALPSTTAQ